ncbi:MAG: DUF4974 domain-containing protein [Bacteroidales bacterium]
MDDNLLIKYFKGEAGESEIDSIIAWVNNSQQNKDYFAHSKAIWDLSGKEPIIRNNAAPAKRTKTIFRILYFSSAAAIIILLSLNLFLEHTANISAPATVVKNIADNIVTIYTTKGVKGKVILPDSTTVWMNSDSKISYPVHFEPNKRDVNMSGEIYFEVKKDSTRPMYVNTNKNLKVEVKGTSFVIKSYNNDNESKTTLFNGSIVLHYKDTKGKTEKTIRIKPQESIVCNDRNTIPILTRPKDINKEIAWRDGQLLFENTPMKEAIKILERWYGVSFIIHNHTIYNYKLTSTFHSESITQVLDLMKYCMPLKFEVKNNVVILN